jgi:hypothetical protein
MNDSTQQETNSTTGKAMKKRGGLPTWDPKEPGTASRRHADTLRALVDLLASHTSDQSADLARVARAIADAFDDYETAAVRAYARAARFAETLERRASMLDQITADMRGITDESTLTGYLFASAPGARKILAPIEDPKTGRRAVYGIAADCPYQFGDVVVWSPSDKHAPGVETYGARLFLEVMAGRAVVLGVVTSKSVQLFDHTTREAAAN